MTNNLPDIVRHPHSIKIIFARVYNYINEMRALINDQRGWLFIKEHTHSRDDLLKHDLFSEIYAELGSVEHLVVFWNSQQTIDDDTKQLIDFYFHQRIEVEKTLASLRLDIIERAPTMLERIVEAIEMLIRRVGKLLPAIASPILEMIGIRLTPHQKQITKRSSNIDDFISKRL